MGRAYISGPRTECLSVYQWSVPEKEAWWLMKYFFKNSAKVRFVLAILENSSFIANELP